MHTTWPTPIIGLDTLSPCSWIGKEQQSGICYDGRLHAVAGPVDLLIDIFAAAAAALTKCEHYDWINGRADRSDNDPSGWSVIWGGGPEAGPADVQAAILRHGGKPWEVGYLPVSDVLTLKPGFMNIVIPALDAAVLQQAGGTGYAAVAEAWNEWRPESIYCERPSVVGGLVTGMTGQGLAAMRAGSDIVSTCKESKDSVKIKVSRTFPGGPRNGTETVAVRGTDGTFRRPGTPQERRTPPAATPGMGQRIETFLRANPGASRTDVRKGLGLQRGKSAAYQAFMATWPNGTEYHAAG